MNRQQYQRPKVEKASGRSHPSSGQYYNVTNALPLWILMPLSLLTLVQIPLHAFPLSIASHIGLRTLSAILPWSDIIPLGEFPWFPSKALRWDISPRPNHHKLQVLSLRFIWMGVPLIHWAHGQWSVFLAFDPWSLSTLWSVNAPWSAFDGLTWETVCYDLLDADYWILYWSLMDWWTELSTPFASPVFTESWWITLWSIDSGHPSMLCSHILGWSLVLASGSTPLILSDGNFWDHVR